MSTTISTFWLRALMGMAVLASWTALSGSVSAAEPPDDEPSLENDDRGEPTRDRPAEPRGRRRGAWQERRGERERDIRGDLQHRERSSRRGEDAPPMLEEIRVLAMEVIRHKLPEYYERLVDLKRHRPERFERTLRRLLPVVWEYVKLRERDEKLAETIIEEFRIEERLRELGAEYREAGKHPGVREELEQEIGHLVREQIHLRMMRHEARLRDIEERLRRQHERFEQERERFEQEMARMDDLVAARIHEVIRGQMRDRMRERGPGRMEGPEFAAPRMRDKQIEERERLERRKRLEERRGRRRSDEPDEF